MLHSRGCGYAIRALTYLATFPEGHVVTVKEISRQENIPEHYLSKVFNTLSRGGLVASKMGPGGGFFFSVRPEDVSIADIIACVDGAIDPEQCVLGVGRCSSSSPCGLHDAWEPVQASLRQWLAQINLQTMSQAVAAKRASAHAGKPKSDGP